MMALYKGKGELVEETLVLGWKVVPELSLYGLLEVQQSAVPSDEHPLGWAVGVLVFWGDTRSVSQSSAPSTAKYARSPFSSPSFDDWRTSMTSKICIGIDHERLLTASTSKLYVGKLCGVTGRKLLGSPQGGLDLYLGVSLNRWRGRANQTHLEQEGRSTFYIQVL